MADILVTVAEHGRYKVAALPGVEVEIRDYEDFRHTEWEDDDVHLTDEDSQHYQRMVWRDGECIEDTRSWMDTL